LIVPFFYYWRRHRPTMRGAFRLGVLLAWMCWLPIAHAVERPGDLTSANELRGHALSAAAIQGQLLAMAESAPRGEQFELYRTYSDSISAWLQVGFVRGLLDASIAATSTADEQRFRTDLRDHARFAAWELDQNIANLDASVTKEGPAGYSRLLEILRALAAEVQNTVFRLATDQ
jgi:hypothetical protein